MSGAGDGVSGQLEFKPRLVSSLLERNVGVDKFLNLLKLKLPLLLNGGNNHINLRGLLRGLCTIRDVDGT